MVGWLNDPNGLCEFNGVYHVFYQYSPSDPRGGLKFWGHLTTKDFINWQEEDVAIYPDQYFDLHGAFSGSSFIENETMYVYYTGTVKREGYNEDYRVEGMEQNTILITSKDGINFSEKNLLLKNEDYPNMSWHVRDPKVWKEDDYYYMVLGARDKIGEGCILIYTSKDKENWDYVNTIKTKEKFGYMWECPDLIKIEENLYLLITCPQGVAQNEELVNVHQCGYFILKGDIRTKDIEISDFITLDRGFDMYAPQSFVDEKGRRILIGWLSISDTPFDYPTIKKGWNHCLSIPREIEIRNNKIYQKPLRELENLREKEISFELNKDINFDYLNLDKYEINLEFTENPKDLEIKLRKDLLITYSKEKEVFEISFKESGYGRDKRKCKIKDLKDLRIFMDTSSIEIFINKGLEVFSSRVFPQEEDRDIRIKGKELKGIGRIYFLKSFEYK